ncbi:MAG: GNAT family N-acetyltransferase [Eubacteriales bacterium]|nr:GNAT family N-acetyltransferase [Eubacteriales bacterium]
MQIRHASEADFQRMTEIYTYARDFMAAHGNPNQWGPTHWPPESLLFEDIQRGKSYVCTEEERVIGTFFFDFGEDIEPTYRVIEKGSWRNNDPFGVVHRLAGDGSQKGIGAFCLNFAYEQCGHLRVDTHTDNIIMQNLLTKLGFEKRGIIHVEEDAYPRYAYEK